MGSQRTHPPSSPPFRQHESRRMVDQERQREAEEKRRREQDHISIGGPIGTAAQAERPHGDGTGFFSKAVSSFAGSVLGSGHEQTSGKPFQQSQTRTDPPAPATSRPPPVQPRSRSQAGHATGPPHPQRPQAPQRKPPAPAPAPAPARAAATDWDDDWGDFGRSQAPPRAPGPAPSTDPFASLIASDLPAAAPALAPAGSATATAAAATVAAAAVPAGGGGMIGGGGWDDAWGLDDPLTQPPASAPAPVAGSVGGTEDLLTGGSGSGQRPEDVIANMSMPSDWDEW